MIKFLLLLFLYTNIFALSPFSLENMKEVNIKIIDKNKFASEETLEKIQQSVKNSFFNLGLKTTTEKFSNFIIKIQGANFADNYAIHISLLLIEECYPIRDKKVETMSITYYKEDLFKTTTTKLQEDIYDSSISYLLDDMIAQYKVENE